ncbi:hypothetical protein UB51_09055 [Paenibacillus sp. IHBB 10380]|nr:hypothetical protein UB51_09055 [Paenibacillus sp. IHBB 10380]
MVNIPSGDNHGGAVCDDPHVRFCERPMQLRMGLLDMSLRLLGFLIIPSWPKIIRQQVEIISNTNDNDYHRTAERRTLNSLVQGP